MIINKLRVSLTALTTAASIGLACMPTAYGVDIVNSGSTRAVGHVVWQNEVDIDPQQLINRAFPANSSSLFFIRRYDSDPERLSANIAINDRFQVSLHPGNYTQLYSCAGINRLSAEPTGLKTNDLLLDASDYELEAGETYFFYIDVNDQGNSQIQQITPESALETLQNKRYQSHQVTRVVPNCPAPAPVAPPHVAVEIPVVVVETPPPVYIPPPAPVLQEQVSIELEILFDNDKAIIKPQFANEVVAVANFMKEYPNTTAVIEGHTDNTGSESYNQALSTRRAEAVKQMLVIQYGIDPNRLIATGYGELRPRASNATESGRQDNRRVVAVINERQ